MEFVELRPGLYRWEVPHPEWTPADAEDGGWEEVVAGYALDGDEGLVLIDPLAPADGTEAAERFWDWVSERVGSGAGPFVLITIFWHSRSSQGVLDRFSGASVWSYEPARELVSERTAVTHGFRDGEELPGEIVAYHAGRALEVVLWVPSHRALVAGFPGSWVQPPGHSGCRARRSAAWASTSTGSPWVSRSSSTGSSSTGARAARMSS